LKIIIFFKGIITFISVYGYMEITKTVRLKLQALPGILMPTITNYTRAYNFVCQTAWSNDKSTDGVFLHHQTYKTVREYLSADLAISARVKATESIQSVKKLQEKENRRAERKGREPKIYRCPQSKQMSIRYNDKTFSIWFDKNKLSLQTIAGRIKLPIDLPKYYKEYVNWKRCSAELIIRDDKVFLNIVFSKSVTDPISNGKCVGIDRGVKRIAVTSNKHFYGGGRVKQVSNRYQRLRSVLQSKGHSGKRHLVKIKNKENRFRRDVNHCISKQIVSTLEPGTTIVFEDLTNINKNTVKRFKKIDTTNKQKQRDRMSWSFYQLEQFITYKSFDKGCPVCFVSPVNTSRKCSKCGHTSEDNRSCQSVFKCVECGYQCNADLNASFNIRDKHLEATSYSGEGAINHPNAPLLIG
jgi:putative transposase